MNANKLFIFKPFDKCGCEDYFKDVKIQFEDDDMATSLQRLATCDSVVVYRWGPDGNQNLYIEVVKQLDLDVYVWDDNKPTLCPNYFIDDSEDFDTILSEADHLVNGDRRKSYGHPSVHFSRTIGMINSLFSDHLKKPFLPHHWAQMIMLDKQSRCMESPSKRDHWVDGAGYSECGHLCVEYEAETGLIE